MVALVKQLLGSRVEGGVIACDLYLGDRLDVHLRTRRLDISDYVLDDDLKERMNNALEEFAQTFGVD